MTLLARDFHGDRPTLAVHRQVSADHPAAGAGWIDRRRFEANLRELIRIENLGAQHPGLNFVAIL